MSDAKLTYREKEILKLRYGIDDGYTYTLEEVGRIFKFTRERVRGVEKKAVTKLVKFYFAKAQPSKQSVAPER